MRWSYAIISVLVLCMFSMFALFFFEEATISNEQDYYLLKENVEAAMFDSVDIAYYRDTGKIKISKEKFVENFIRRFAENGKLGEYTIRYYDIMEEPPKVTVQITDRTGDYNIYTGMPGNVEDKQTTSVDVVNEISGIIDAKECYITRRLYSSAPVTTKVSNFGSTCQNLELNDDISVRHSCYVRDGVHIGGVSYSYKWFYETGGMNTDRTEIRSDGKGATEFAEIKGYIPIKVNYVMSWRDYALKNTPEGGNYMDTINYLSDLYYEQYDSTYVWTGKSLDTSGTHNFNGFADVYLQEIGIAKRYVGGVVKYYFQRKYDFACYNVGKGKYPNDSEDYYFCNPAFIYDVLYKSTSAECNS